MKLAAAVISRLAIAAALAAVWAPVGARRAEATPPTGFVVDMESSGWNEAVGALFLPDQRLLHWQRGGEVYLHENERVHLVLNLREEVGGWRDHGLLGVALHPNFEANGFIYLFYVVDRHHALTFGTGGYDPQTDWYHDASIARITRYTLTAASGFTQVDPTSRLVLVGESTTTGFPIAHQSHAVGSLQFGEDGTLLASFGDSASYESVDVGGQVSGGYVTSALAAGFLAPKEDVGAYRAQMVDSLCGKVLRLDPDTGNGVPSNPWFDAAAPRAPRSRVWCLGLRNPFRMSMVPESGSHDPADGDPGTLLIGDVQWNAREDLNVADRGGLNFGWPAFEGLTYQNEYWAQDTANPDAVNPLGGGACPATMQFRSLIVQDTQDPVSFPNPCALLQAEQAAVSGPGLVSTYAGYSGSGYADYGSSNGQYVEWTIAVPQSGNWTLAFRQANGGTTSRPLRLIVDGVNTVNSLAFPPTGSWTQWNWVTHTMSLTAGTHLVRLRSIVNTGPNVDCMAFHNGAGISAVPASIPTHEHTRPVVDWSHGGANARTPGYNLGASTEIALGATGPVAGEAFGGSCAVGGPELTNPAWPSQWRGVRVFGDFSWGWLRTLRYGANGTLVAVEPFDTAFGAVVGIVEHPSEPTIYAIRWGSEIVRIRWLPGGSAPPTARISSTQNWGASPLAVTLDGSTSSDPEGGALSYAWDFGDGTTGSGAIVNHSFSAPTGGPARFDVRLTVTDPAGLTHQAVQVVSPNNTPPTVDIVSIFDGQFYPMNGGDTTFPLLAAVTDPEHGSAGVACQWRVNLHHNTHEHPEPPDFDCASSAVVTSVGCGDEDFWFEVEFTGTDAHGLLATDVANLMPDCNGALNCPGDLDGDSDADGGDLAVLLGQWGPTSGAAADFDHDGAISGADLAFMLANWGVCP